LRAPRGGCKKIREDAAKAAGNAEGEQAAQAARAKKIIDLEREIDENKLEAASLKPNITALFQRFDGMEPAMQQCREDSASAGRQRSAVVRKLQDLHSDSGGGNIAVFGEKCLEMNRRVQGERGFKGRVIGPIGAQLKIRAGAERFAKLAESAIGGAMDKFICTNDYDRTLLVRIRAEVGCNPRQCNIFQVHVHARYSVKQESFDEGIEKMSSVLAIEDDLVYNCLVDNSKIDVRALAVSKQVSESGLLSTDGNGRECIKGDIQFVHFLPQGDHWKVNRGSRTVTSNERGLNRQTIGVDKTAAIKETEREHAVLKQEVEDMKKREMEMLKEIKEVKVKWNVEQRKLFQREDKRKKDQAKLDDLKNEPDTSVNVNAIDTTEFEEDVTECEESLKLLKDNEVSILRKIEELEPDVSDIEKKREEVMARNNRVLGDLDKAGVRMENVINKQQQREKEFEKKKKRCENIEEAVTENGKELDGIREKESDALSKAKLMTQRIRAKNDANEEIDIADIQPIETDRSPEYYKTRISQMLKKLENEKEKRRLAEDPQETHDKLQKAMEDLELIMKTVKTIEQNRDLLVSDLRVRKKKWKHFRKHIASSTNLLFDQMLNKRGSSGELEFDHENRTLNLTVQKDNTDEMSQTKDVKALSGGERSFTTLALLLALGENLETPFRVMDEFDVFLDAMNRKIAIDNMIRAAKQMEHRQFIFITPQDLSGLNRDPMLKIIRMKTPERDNFSQGTLPFSSQST